MVEIHLVRRVGHAAVSARSLPSFSEQFDGPMLADAHPCDLEVTIAPVVIGVRRSLVATSHGYSLEHLV
jgi:hypothetical protein